ncbi:MAG: OmpA family protein [Nitrospirae bacterium YQR-1]
MIFRIIFYLSLPSVAMFMLAGCAGFEFTPKGKVLYTHKELTEADRAIERAQKAGKDKECPDEFGAVVKLRDEAYEVYWNCHTQEAIDLAKKVPQMANNLCRGGRYSSNPVHVSRKEAAVVTVVNFDVNTSKIRKDNEKQLNTAVETIKQYQQPSVRVEGHTDTVGGYDYNMRLSKRRAEVAKDYIVRHGAISADKVETVGYGYTQPVDTNETAAGRARNRRADIRIFSR